MRDFQKNDKMIGEKFGRLTVISFFDSCKNSLRYSCNCDCGTKNFIAYGKLLRAGNTKSCGCLATESKSKNGKRNKKFNEYRIIDEKTMSGKSHNSEDIFYFDIEDFDKIKNFCWSLYSHTGRGRYMRSRIPNSKKGIFLHRLIMDCPDSFVDHKNRDTLDNRKTNLRIANFSENSSNAKNRKDNKSGVKGVVWIETKSKWRACLQVNKKRVLIKHFDSFIDAVIARLSSEKEYLGEFAPQKNLFEEYNI